MIDVNCDVGEGVNNEELLMPYISSCNIACGGHAGDLETMTNVVSLAIKHNVKIGAHPSYPDRENFGRKSMVISDEDLAITIVKQIKTLEQVVSTSERQLHHIKPHGTLYNDIAKNTALANVFLDAIASYRNTCALYVPFTSEIAHEAMKRNFKVVYEAFADRNYNDDHSLVARNEDNAVITDIHQIIEHVSLMKGKGKVRTITGRQLAIKASTFCVHSDTDNAIEMVKAIHDRFF